MHITSCSVKAIRLPTEVHTASSLNDYPNKSLSIGYENPSFGIGISLANLAFKILLHIDGNDFDVLTHIGRNDTCPVQYALPTFVYQVIVESGDGVGTVQINWFVDAFFV